MKFPGSVVIAAAALIASAAELYAQCPDGTPPPCRSAPVGAAPSAARRPNPPLDDRTWIIVPFDNVTRAPDMEWLGGASVNLLYLDMSKWRDIKVIDDERVADLIRDVPEAHGGGSMTLQSGIAVARRAGAANLVMGDVLKVGSRTQLVGKVFNVRTGQRLRTVRQETTNPDSIMGVFGQLARAVLNVEPPTGTSLGTIGTTSVGAYQAYIAGVGYLNRWILDSAHTQFDRALALDSSFALAHYKLAVVYGWQSANDPEGPRHAELATRLGTNLPARERSLLKGYAAFASNRWADACQVFEGLVSGDSTDVEAWYDLGECSYHDVVVIRDPADSTSFIFRSSWNTSLRAFRKVLELDPSYHLAFQHIQDALLVPVRNGCRLAGQLLSCTTQNGGYQAVLRRAGDTLVTVPILVSSAPGAEAYVRQMAEAKQGRVRRRNLEEARRAAEAWLALGPVQARARIAYARILLRLGEVEAADSSARQVGDARTSRVDGANFMMDRIEIALTESPWAPAVALADSLRTITDSSRGSRNLGILIGSVVGRTAGLPSLAASVQGPPWIKEYFLVQIRSTLGLPADSLFEKEAVVTRNLAGVQGARATNIGAGTLLFVDPATRGGRWPGLDTTSTDPRVALISVLVAGDAARSRRALAVFDSIAVSQQDEPDNGMTLTGAFGHLMIADTAGALTALRRFRDVTWRHTNILDQVVGGFVFAGMLWPRTFLLLGDLEAATGNHAAAAEAYRAFIGMWGQGDPEVRPMVERARAALAKLGG